VDKAGATVLFEEANKGSNNIGVVVTPVRLTSLGEFGSPQFGWQAYSSWKEKGKMLNPETWLSAYTHTSHVVFCPASTFREKIEFSEDSVIGLRGEIVKYLFIFIIVIRNFLLLPHLQLNDCWIKSLKLW